MIGWGLGLQRMHLGWGKHNSLQNTSPLLSKSIGHFPWVWNSCLKESSPALSKRGFVNLTLCIYLTPTQQVNWFYHFSTWQIWFFLPCHQQTLKPKCSSLKYPVSTKAIPLQRKICWGNLGMWTDCKSASINLRLYNPAPNMVYPWRQPGDFSHVGHSETGFQLWDLSTS